MPATVEEILKVIERADMVLVGIGEEFEQKALLEQNPEYMSTCMNIKENRLEWSMPFVNTYYLEKENSRLMTAYQNLKRLLQYKDYFLVSVCMNGFLRQAGFQPEKIAEPCGGYTYMQCSQNCGSPIEKTDEHLLQDIERCCEGKLEWHEFKRLFCGNCESEKVFNSLYADRYAEEGYLAQWTAYTAWLQRTLNKNLCVLELGVGLKYPSVIRWPFEKIAFYNQKAKFVRVHEKLFQMTEELSDRGYSISENAVKMLEDIY